MTTAPKINKAMTIQEILETVSAASGITPAEMLGPRRSRRVCFGRFLAMAAIRTARPHWALIDVSEAVGRGDHATIYHGLNRYRHLFDADREFRRMALACGLAQVIP